MTQINPKIRTLLDRWYAGETSVAEERELRRLMADAVDLPPELEADRKLLLALGELDEAQEELPAEVAARISAALDAEIGRSEKRRQSFAGSRLRQTRLWWGAAAVAACLSGFFIVNHIGEDHRAEKVLATATEKVMSTLTVDSMANTTPAPKERRLPAGMESTMPESLVANNTVAKSSGMKSTGVRQAKPIPQKSVIIEEDEAVSVGEPTLLAEADMNLARPENYRIVDNNEEAGAILTSIFSKLDRYMELETGKLRGIGVEYAAEIQKINDLGDLNPELENLRHEAI